MLLICSGISVYAETKRAITASDCVTVREVFHDDLSWRSSIVISRDGTKVAYPVKAPNIGTNKNDIELYIKRFPEDSSNSGKPILVGDMSGIRWMADGKHMTALIREDGRRMIEEVDVENGNHKVLFETDGDIAEYSLSEDGNTVVFAIAMPNAGGTNGKPTHGDNASGYLIPFQQFADASWPKEELFASIRRPAGWSKSKAIIVTSPLSRRPLPGLTYASNGPLNPVLSPDGRTLLVTYMDFAQEMPDEWGKSGFMQLRNQSGVIQVFRLLVLYDMASGQTTVPIKTPWVASAPLWSPDSKSFVVVSCSPIGSDLEHEDVISHHIGHSSSSRLFWVQPSNGKVEQVVSKLSYPWEPPLCWNKRGDLFVRTSGMNVITQFVHDRDQWKERASFEIPLHIGIEVATDGENVIGEYDDTMTPPELFLYRSGQKDVQIFAKLNPSFDNLSLAQPKEIHWKTVTGFNATGLLLVPPGYVKGMKYPLVIQTKPFGNYFACSNGIFPSFAPQPIANAGILYLGTGQMKDETLAPTQQEEEYFPKGYPGYQGFDGIAEAAFNMDLWDSAIKSLDSQGMIDTNRIGIVGFSRTGWYTEFILAHSQTHYAAATVADNVQYSLGEYWLLHDQGTIKSYDLTYGGPPYGATFENWLKYSVSFNLDKIHTPLLMEEMGNGAQYSDINAPPIGLAASFEVFTGLNRLNRPVELYYYPNESHTPDHPQARLATLQRNLDWYRFWLQGYERPNPEDPGQYKRWEHLRELQNAENNAAENVNLPRSQ
jgi:Tol biopolymer transport system component